jgi:hypothetical protein
VRFFEGTYQVTEELGGIGGESILRQSHTELETSLRLSTAVGDTPGVEDDARVRVSEGDGNIVLGEGRRQDYEVSVSDWRV